MILASTLFARFANAQSSPILLDSTLLYSLKVKDKYVKLGDGNPATGQVFQLASGKAGNASLFRLIGMGANLYVIESATKRSTGIGSMPGPAVDSKTVHLVPRGGLKAGPVFLWNEIRFQPSAVGEGGRNVAFECVEHPGFFLGSNEAGNSLVLRKGKTNSNTWFTLESQETPDPSTANYIVSIKTSDRGEAGTDSNIVMKLIGTKGESPFFEVNPLVYGNAFERNDKDVFTYKSSKFLGPIKTIILEKDHAYAGNDWHCDHVSVIYIHPDLPLSPVIFAQPENYFIGRVVASTFPIEEWVDNMKYMVSEGGAGGEATMKEGAKVEREEPSATLIDTSVQEVANGTAIIMFSNDNLGTDSRTNSDNSGSEETETLTFTTTNSLRIEQSSGKSTSLGAEMEVGYSPAEKTGGVHSSLKLSAAYEWVSSQLEERYSENSVTLEKPISVYAEGRSITFAFYEIPSRNIAAVYKGMDGSLYHTRYSVIQGRYQNPQRKSLYHPKYHKDYGVQDAEWNIGIAKPYALANGKAQYERMVNYLKGYGILSDPITYDTALTRP